MVQHVMNCQLNWKQHVNRIPKLAYSYNLEGQKIWQDPKVDDEISSKSSEHRNELAASSPPNWRKKEKKNRKYGATYQNKSMDMEAVHNIF